MLLGPEYSVELFLIRQSGSLHQLLNSNKLEVVLRCRADNLYLMSAWPLAWDVKFRLNAFRNTTVECIFQDGEIKALGITPDSRKSDVQNMTTVN